MNFISALAIATALVASPALAQTAADAPQNTTCDRLCVLMITEATGYRADLVASDAPASVLEYADTGLAKLRSALASANEPDASDRAVLRGHQGATRVIDKIHEVRNNHLQAQRERYCEKSYGPDNGYLNYVPIGGAGENAKYCAQPMKL